MHEVVIATPKWERRLSVAAWLLLPWLLFGLPFAYLDRSEQWFLVAIGVFHQIAALISLIWSDWFRFQYRVTPEEITKVRRSGKTTSARWDELVKISQYSLHFEDGTRIDIPNGWRRVVAAKWACDQVVVNPQLSVSDTYDTMLRRLNGHARLEYKFVAWTLLGVVLPAFGLILLLFPDRVEALRASQIALIVIPIALASGVHTIWQFRRFRVRRARLSSLPTHHDIFRISQLSTKRD